VDTSIVLGIALAAGPLFVLHPGPTALGALALAWTLRGRVGRAALAVAAVLLVLGAFRARERERAYEARRAADAEVGAIVLCEGEGEITASPGLLGGGLRAPVELRGTCAGRPWSGATMIAELPASVARGDRVAVRARLGPVQRFFNEADPQMRLARGGTLRSGRALEAAVVARGRGPPAWIDRARAHVRSRILATFPARTEALARALVLGETDVAQDDAEAFRASGLSHLLAVSGMHLVLVVVGAVAAIRALLRRIGAVVERFDPDRVAAAAGIPLAGVYADFAGGSGSATRACWMLSAALLARALGRRADTPRAFGVSILLMAALDPLVALDLSFVLSAAATAGLLAFGRPMDALMSTRLPSLVARVARSASATVAATLACAPVLALFSPDLPVGGVLANVVAVPIGELAALPLCLAHAFFAPVEALERGCALAASGALDLVRWIARAFSLATWSAVSVPVPTPIQVAALSVLLVATRARKWREAICAAAVLIGGEALARRRAHGTGELSVTFLDVGQGDAAIVSLPDGSALLIDGGGLVGSPLDVGARVLGPELRARRIDRLRAVVLSHPHPDHFLGLRSGLARVRVDELWDTGQGEQEGAEGAYGALLDRARRQGTIVRRPNDLCGSRALGGARVEVLAPCPAVVTDRGPNDNSFVLRVRYGRRAVLFVGDAERAEEDDLLARSADLRADVLKVGHHGSRTSSQPRFLASVGAAHAVVSVGARNSFGHPHAETLAALAANGTAVWRTDRDGAVTMTTDGDSLHVWARARQRANSSPERRE
jgi:competence protein ComEC